MLQYNRQQTILDYLRVHHSAKISELAKHIYTSEASVRRDLAVLEAEGVVMRVYGGVVLSEHKNEVVPIELRDSANSAAKEAIASEAAKHIHDGDTVFFDSSSTVRRICKHIKKRKNLIIVTNNLRILSELKDTQITVYCTGGELYKKRDAFLGPYAERFVSSFYADSLFFSCSSLSNDGVITDVSEAEVSMRSIMRSHARNSYFLCDSSKLHKTDAFRFCASKEITQILCDVPLPDFEK